MHLNKKGYKIQKKTMQMYEIVKNVERIADEFKYIIDVFKDYNGKIEIVNLQFLSKVVDYYLNFYNIMYKFKPELKQSIILDQKPLIDKLKIQMKTSKTIEERMLIHHMISLVRKVYDGAAGYFTLTL